MCVCPQSDSACCGCKSNVAQYHWPRRKPLAHAVTSSCARRPTQEPHPEPGHGWAGPRLSHEHPSGAIRHRHLSSAQAPLANRSSSARSPGRPSRSRQLTSLTISYSESYELRNAREHAQSARVCPRVSRSPSLYPLSVRETPLSLTTPCMCCMCIHRTTGHTDQAREAQTTDH